MDELSVAFSALSLHGPSFFRILDLPLELFSSVCDHLDDDSLRKTRLVCRTVSHRSTFTFGTRFLAHLVALPRWDSLAVLLYYARHEKLSRFVRTISMSGEIGGSPSMVHVGMSLSKAEDMLTEALRKFVNLETIRIDSLSYVQTWHLTGEVVGLRCGPERLTPQQLRCDFSALSHLLQVMMGSINRANICDRIHLDLDLRVMSSSPYSDTDNSPIQAELFNISSPFWKERLSRRVRKFQARPSDTSGWASHLAASCSELKELELLPSGGRIKFGNRHGDVHVWQHLQDLAVSGVDLENTAIAGFFEAHQSTLTQLHLGYIVLDNGSWKEILQTIHDLPILEGLSLSCLGQNVAYATAPETDSDARSCFRCDKRSDVLLALRALLQGVQTYKHQLFYEDYYRIDFTSANIALASKAAK